MRPFEEASLLALNSNSEGLSKALRELDQVATRTQDTVLVFYVKSEQGDPYEIIENQVSKGVIEPPVNYIVEILLIIVCFY